MTSRVTLVSGDFVRTGGQDRANYALADYLARTGRCVHLISHQVEPQLLARPRVTFEPIQKPFNSYTLGNPLLKLAAHRAWRRGWRVIANGGNGEFVSDANWVHYVHASRWQLPHGCSIPSRGWLRHLRYRIDLAEERRALRKARRVIVNSRRTAADLAKLGLAKERVYVVYYGLDAAQFQPVRVEERQAARQSLGLSQTEPVGLFVGALGDERKGFDTLYEAWREFGIGTLLVVGRGKQLATWQKQITADSQSERVRLLGFRKDVPALLAAADIFIAPTRYEAYGLAVHESLCRGVPAIVSARAGVAERYSPELAPLLLHDPNDCRELVRVLQDWQARSADFQAATLAVSDKLRAWTWDHMAATIANILEI